MERNVGAVAADLVAEAVGDEEGHARADARPGDRAGLAVLDVDVATVDGLVVGSHQRSRGHEGDIATVVTDRRVCARDRELRPGRRRAHTRRRAREVVADEHVHDAVRVPGNEVRGRGHEGGVPAVGGDRWRGADAVGLSVRGCGADRRTGQERAATGGNRERRDDHDRAKTGPTCHPHPPEMWQHTVARVPTGSMGVTRPPRTGLATLKPGPAGADGAAWSSVPRRPPASVGPTASPSPRS